MKVAKLAGVDHVQNESLRFKNLVKDLVKGLVKEAHCLFDLSSFRPFVLSSFRRLFKVAVVVEKSEKHRCIFPTVYFQSKLNTLTTNIASPSRQNQG